MRTALLSAVKRTLSGEFRAELELAGRSVLAWQVDLVRALGCERVVCLCEAPRASILAVQKQVESQGGEFHTVRSNLQLVGLVRADDELVMLADGLLVEREIAANLLGDDGDIERAVATISSAHRLAKNYPEDFERVDRDRHWAGIAVMRAGQVHKLADMPPDGDAMSMLLRLALQARVECRDWSDQGPSEANWLLATDQAALSTRETALIGESVAQVPVWAPFQALSAALVRRLGVRGLATGPQAAAGGGIAIMLGGVGVAAQGWVAAGLLLAACGAFAAMLAGQWSILRERLWSLPRGPIFEKALPMSVDAMATACLIVGYMQGEPPLPALALPIFAIAISQRLGRGEPLGSAIPFWDDRALHLAGFAIVAALGWLGEALALFGLAALANFMLRSRRDTG